MCRKIVSLFIVALIILSMLTGTAFAAVETGEVLVNIYYNANGGEGTVPEAIPQIENATVIVSDGKELINGALVFWKWNTQSDGGGKDYFPGDEFIFTAETTLYAVYKESVHVSDVTLSKDTERMLIGSTLTLTASVFPENTSYSEITWTSSNEAVATVDQNGLVTATARGEAVITAAADGMSDTCTVAVVANEYTVVFITQGGPEIPDIKILEGGNVSEPDQLSRDGYSFEGWYKEQACINPWSFDTDTVTSNIILYAEWRKDGCAFSGSGTQDNPYRITNAGELAELSSLVNAGNALYADKCYIQTQDIDLSGYDNWAPIGTYISKPFSGIYNGNGNKLAELKINVEQTELGAFGLFGYITGAVRNLTIFNSNIKLSTNNNIFVGSIVGYTQKGTVQNCNVSNTNITVISNLIGNVGGIVGWANNSTILGANFSGSINGKGNQIRIGGITGIATEGTNITICSNRGNIISENGYAGGITGYSNTVTNYCRIEKCYNIGNVNAQGTSESFSGGIIGFLVKTNIKDCYNSGVISSTKNTEIGSGGIVGIGNINSTIQNCYNIGIISGYYRGGIMGRNDGSTNVISNCYYSNSCESAVGSGTGTAYKKSLDELRRQLTFTGFDFDSIWTMDEADETGFYYPQIKGNLLYTQKHELLLNADNEQGFTEGSGSFSFSEIVTITAHENEYYVFKNWEVSAGGVNLTEPYSMTTTFMMPDRDVSIEAVFEKQKYTLTVESAGDGTVSGGGSYAWGENIPVIAKADSGYQFDYWEGALGQPVISDLNDMTAVVTMPKSNAAIKAVFCTQPADYRYTVKDEEATITGYTGTASSIVIPDRLGGYRVKAINSSAFVDNNYLAHVTIPDSIETIGQNAFSECTALIDICIGRGVKDIGFIPFDNCPALQEITVSEENAYFKSEDGVLYNKTGTELICCPPGRIGTFTVPDGVENIHESAFDHCTYITDIEIPDCVVSIERFAFNNCTSLKDIHNPDSVISIGEYAFLGCRNLQSIILPHKIAAISSYTFSGCNMLKDVTIPDSVISIGYEAFGDCTSLENVTLSNNLESIGARAFNSCNLKSIHFPKSLEEIEVNAFSNNLRLTEAYFMGAKPDFGAGVFAQSATGLKIYYHVAERTSWVSYSAPKQAFCFVTMKYNNEQPDETKLVLLNNFMIQQVAPPKWDEHTFEGWYKDEACTALWDFAKVTADNDITLHAKWRPGPYNISVVSSNASYGSVSGGGEYDSGKEIMLHAVPSEGHRFIRWIAGGDTISCLADYTVTVTAGCVYTAEFEAIGIPEITSIAFVGNYSIRIEWSEVTGAAGYQIWRCDTGDGEYELINETGSTSYTDRWLTMNTTYYYMVSAYCTAGEINTYGEQSEYVSQETVLPAPVIISAQSAGYETTRITWNQVQGATGYEIFRSTTDSGAYSFVYSTPQTSYTNTKLKTGTTYFYKIRAYSDAEYPYIYSEFSDSVFCVPVPQKVAEVSSSVHSSTSVKLKWGKTPGRSGYEVWRSTLPDSGFFRVETTSDTYCYDTVKPNTKYYYIVRAYRNVGKKRIPGDFSDPVAAQTTLASVTDITVKMYYPTSIKISWSAIKGCKGYEVERSEYPDKEFKVIKSTSSTYYKDTELVTNTKYYYRVCAYVVVDSERVRSDYSKVVSDIPVLSKVTGVKASVSSPTKIKISWSSVSGCSGYEILRSETEDGVYNFVYSTSRTYYYDSGLEPNKTYYYKVRAYRTFSGIKKYGEESDVKSALPVFGSATGTAASSYSSSKNKITWKAVSGSSGYEVYRSETSVGELVYIGSTTYTYYYDKYNIAGKTYYYCVRAYVMVGISRFYTDYSNTACVMRTP